MVARPRAGLLLAAKKGMEGFLEEAVVLDVFIEIAKNQSQTLSISAKVKPYVYLPYKPKLDFAANKLAKFLA